jgi:hypothetical protein
MFQIFTSQFPVSPDIRSKIKKIVIYLSPGCWMQKAFCEYLVCSEMAAENLPGLSKKKIT